MCTCVGSVCIVYVCIYVYIMCFYAYKGVECILCIVCVCDGYGWFVYVCICCICCMCVVFICMYKYASMCYVCL